MNIKQLKTGNSGLHAGTPISTETSKRVESASGDGTKPLQPVSPVKDKIEISKEAREASNDTKARELAFARKALLGIPPLTKERILEIQSRIKEAYYMEPENIQELAKKLSRLLGEDE